MAQVPPNRLNRPNTAMVRGNFVLAEHRMVSTAPARTYTSAQPLSSIKPAAQMLTSNKVTSQMALDRVNEVTKQISTPQARKEIADSIKSQAERERSLLNTVRVCSIPQLNSLQDRLGSLQAQEFSRVLRDDFFNPSVMQAAMCTAESIYLGQPFQGAIATNTRIRNWFRNLEQIGSESVEGVALRGDLENAEGAFIVKAPRDIANRELLHEYFIGVHGTNKMRSFVPNFAYVFGGFQCSPPIIDPDTKKVTAWCNNTDNSVSYVLYENIAPAVSMKDFVKTCTFDQFLAIYMQILYALDKAQRVIDFTHYDLHYENVLVRKIGTPKFSIPYETEKGKTEYLFTDGIGTIIDYGLSHFVFDNQNFGAYTHLAYSVFPNRSFPMQDAYKLLMFSMASMWQSNNMKCLEGALKILKFFTTENFESVVRNQQSISFYLPYTEELVKLRHFDLTAYIRTVVPTPFLREQPGPERVIGCSHTDSCLAYNGVIREFGLDKPPRADTIFEFFDLVTRLEKEGKTSVVQQAVQTFNYPVAVQNELRRILGLLNESKQILSTLTIVQLRGTPPTTLFDLGVLTQYKRFVSKVSKLYDNLQEINVSVTATTYATQVYSDHHSQIRITQIAEEAKQLTPSLAEALNSIEDDQKYLDQVAQTYPQYMANQIHTNREFAWYWKGLRAIDYMIPSHS